MEYSSKKQSEETKSKQNEGQQKGTLKEELTFDIQIKRESRFLPKWKKRSCHIIYIPNSQLSMTFKNKEKGNQVEEIINLLNARLSKRCSNVENHHCFGMEIATGKRYLISRETQVKTLVLFDNVVRLKKYFRQVTSTPKTKSQKLKHRQTQGKIANQSQLQFERSNGFEQTIQKPQKELQYTDKISKTSPAKTQRQKHYEFQQLYPQRPQMIEAKEEDEEYRTVMEEESIIVMEKEPQLHLKIPLTPEQLSYLENDEGFKLRQNFNEGRILQKGEGLLKANLLIKTHLNEFELLQSLFHLQLWNDRVQLYEIKNRIDQGIYLVYLQLKKKNFFSRAKYCYLMASALIIDAEPCLILKSLEENSFDRTSGCEWIDFTMWAKIRGTDLQSMQKFLTVCLKIKDSRNHQLCIAFVNQVKAYQSFLFTTAKLPYQILQWRASQRGIVF